MTSSRQRHTIGIVGGGMAGTVAAVQLARCSIGPVDLVLIDRSGEFGPGVAYSTPNDEHLLNQPAARMSAFDDAPDHFRAWAESRIGAVDPGAFLPRRLYGDYLRGLLDGVAHRRIRGHVVALEPQADGIGLRLADGVAIDCDRVVLAVGPLPANPLSALPAHPQVFSDPWAPGALDPAPGSTTVLIGSGLTAIDATLSLCRSPAATVVAVSRNGMLPYAHLDGLRQPAPSPALPTQSATVATLERAVRQHAARMTPVGYDWRDVVDGIRPIVPELWRSLPVAEQRRFVETHARAWEVRRHRMAPEVAERLHHLRETGRFTVRAGAVAAAAARGRRIEITVRLRECGTLEASQTDRVIGCTGPATDIRHSQDPLIRSLLADGAAVADPLGLGLRTSTVGAVIDAGASASSMLFAVGALRRGELWESTAVAELRGQGRETAVAVLQSLAVTR